MKYKNKQTGEIVEAYPAKVNEPHGNLILDVGLWKLYKDNVPLQYAPSDESFKNDYEPVADKKPVPSSDTTTL